MCHSRTAAQTNISNSKTMTLNITKLLTQHNIIQETFVTVINRTTHG